MSEFKKKPKKTQKRSKRKEPSRPRERKRSAAIRAEFVKVDILREIQYITQRAQARDSRVVKVESLVLFSTGSQDAWLLDAEDDFALCLCRDGEPQSFRVLDAPETFVIEWTADFAIDGDAFVVYERSGRVVEILSYPTLEISAACRH